MNIFTFENGPFMVNTYLLVNGKACVVIDPGSEIDPMMKKISSEELVPEAILCTHGHIDHIAGVNTVRKKYDIPFYLNEQDALHVEQVSSMARMFGVDDPGKIELDENLPLSGELVFAGLTIQLIHTPGHSKGSVSFMTDGNLISGDALFNLSIGRTDLPGGDYDELIDSIKNRIFTLPENTIVLPGHGPETTIGYEKRMNPFFK